MNARTFAYPGIRIWLARLLSFRENPQPVAPVVLSLPSRTVATFCAGAGARVCVVSGEVWLTEEGTGEDVCLASGQAYGLRGTGKVVLEACRGASICRVS